MDGNDAMKSNEMRENGNEVAPRTPLFVKPLESSLSEKAIIKRLAAVLLLSTVLCICYLVCSTIIHYYSRIINSAISFLCHLCFVTNTEDWGSLLNVTTSVVVLTTIFLTFRLNTAGSYVYPSQRVRSLKMWKILSDYFPVQLVLSQELLEYSRHVTRGKQYVTDEGLRKEFCGLPDDRNYMIGHHPHGFGACSAFYNFATESTGISLAFPNLTVHLAVWPPLSRLPGMTLLAKHLGIIAVSKQSLLEVLGNGERLGNLVTVVVGGGPEMHEAHPQRYHLFLKRRFGFFKLALQTGSHLIPCISFGELNTYKHIPNPPQSLLRRFQNWVVDKTGNQLAFAIAYGYGPLPKATPLNTVVGAPIECEKVEIPTFEQVMELKQRYMEALTALYNQYKPRFDPQAGDICFI